MKWSCPEISYAVRELSKNMKKANRSHVIAMYQVFHHVLATKERGLVIQPSESWDGLLDFCLKSQECQMQILQYMERIKRACLGGMVS